MGLTYSYHAGSEEEVKLTKKKMKGTLRRGRAEQRKSASFFLRWQSTETPVALSAYGLSLSACIWMLNASVPQPPGL